MLAKRIIPCLDVQDGRVVKGVQFQNLRDAGDPAELAERYQQAGADELVLLDISASKTGRKTERSYVQQVARRLSIPFTVGGGVGDVADWQRLLRQGADKVAVNSAAVRRPELISAAARQFGSQCVVAAVDVRRQGAGWQVYTHGGTVATGLDALQWIRQLAAMGAGEILLTSMDSDGGLNGYDLQLTRAVAQAVGIPVIASGGAGSLQDFVAVLTEGCADAALAASLFHDQTLTVGDVKVALAKEGVCVRQCN
jgi:cyclase